MKIFSFASEKGASLVEVMIALMIIGLVMLGGGMFFVYGRVHFIREAHRRAAVLVASQRLEELKALDWPPPVISGDDTQTVTTADNLPTPYTITTNALYSDNDGDGNDDRLEVMVTVEWSDSTSNTVSLTTLIADNE